MVAAQWYCSTLDAFCIELCPLDTFIRGNLPQQIFLQHLNHQFKAKEFALGTGKLSTMVQYSECVEEAI